MVVCGRSIIASSALQHISTTPLLLIATSYDLSSIIAAVSTIPGQWRELGSGLGLQPVVLGAIHGPPEVCMVEVIKHWTHEAMAASRQRLSSALVRMGRTDLAEGVMAGVERGKEQHVVQKHWVLMASLDIVGESLFYPACKHVLERFSLFTKSVFPH